MNTKIIIITGKAQSGKDTSANLIKKNLCSLGKTCDIYAFAGELKNICENIFGLANHQCWGSDSDKNTKTNFKWRDLPLPKDRLAIIMNKPSAPKLDDSLTAREVMQIWGTDIFRKFDNDCWVRSTINRIKKENLDFAIIADARFPNEIEYCLKYKPTVIRLTRNVTSNNHESEVALDNYNFDALKSYTIDNQLISIEEQNEKLKNIMKEIINDSCDE
jgi:hypothetical protein